MNILISKVFVTLIAETSLVCTKNEMHVIAQEVSVHCVSCGQIQVVCFSEGCIYYPVKSWPGNWHLWGTHQLGVISLKLFPWPKSGAKMMSPQPSHEVVWLGSSLERLWCYPPSSLAQAKAGYINLKSISLITIRCELRRLVFAQMITFTFCKLNKLLH